jgi:hypothetical protein
MRYSVASVGAGGTQRLGLFWQNMVYAVGPAMPALRRPLAWPKAGATCCGAAAAEVGSVELVSVREPLGSSHGVMPTAATAISPAAATSTARRGRTGGGLLSVLVGGVPVIVMITPCEEVAPIGRAISRSLGRFPGGTRQSSHRSGNFDGKPRSLRVTLAGRTRGDGLFPRRGRGLRLGRGRRRPAHVVTGIRACSRVPRSGAALRLKVPPRA